MSSKSIAFGKFVRKHITNHKSFSRWMRAGIGLESSRRWLVANLKPSYTRWVDYITTKTISEALKGEKVAWVNLFFPGEILATFGLKTVSAEGLSGTLSSMHLDDIAIQKAESIGINRSLCTFHRASVGASEMNLFPAPIAVFTTNILCDGNLPTFAFHANCRKRPFFVIDVPKHISKESEEYLVKQIEDMIAELESLFKSSFDYKYFKKLISTEQETLQILRDAYRKLSHNPLRMKLYQHVNALYSLHLRGYSSEFNKAVKVLSKQLDREQEQPRKRILWLHLVPYYDSELYNIFSPSSDIAVVTSELEWDSLEVDLDPEHPVRSVARKLLMNPEIGPLERRIKFVTQLARDFSVDGVIHFNHWGCKQSSGAVGLIKRRFEELRIPFLSLDGDCVDHTSSSIGQYKTRVEAFLEMIG